MINEHTLSVLEDASAHIRIARDLINSVKGDIDCSMCREDVELLAGYAEDVSYVTKFNLLMAHNPDMIKRLRELLESRYYIRVISIAARVTVFFHRIRHFFKKLYG
jgi:hypothetical protein